MLEQRGRRRGLLLLLLRQVPQQLRTGMDEHDDGWSNQVAIDW